MFSLGSHFYASGRRTLNLAKLSLAPSPHYRPTVAIIAPFCQLVCATQVCHENRHSRIGARTQVQIQIHIQTQTQKQIQIHWRLDLRGSQPASELNSCQRGAFSLRMKNDEQSIICPGGCFLYTSMRAAFPYPALSSIPSLSTYCSAASLALQCIC